MSQLTWYPGTILPHASLWHTLVRATWLNDLRRGELAKASGRQKKSSGTTTQVPQSSFRQALRKSLGDTSNEAFRYGTLDQWPQCLFPGLVARNLRWCPDCLRAGYHSLFSSIRLVTNCPIHGSPLLEACPNCHQTFSIAVNDLYVRPPWACQCRTIRLVEPETCRQPSLTHQQAECWNPVKKWLRELAGVNVGRLQSGDAPINVQLALASWWCRDLGLSYPSCFAKEDAFWSSPNESKCWKGYRAESGKLIDLPDGATDHSNAEDLPQVSVYKSMGLHLRRHGLRRPDRWIVGLMTRVDPATFALNMAASIKARMAFTEMLWARAMEPQVHWRRWPPRRRVMLFGTPFSPPLEQTGYGLQLTPSAGPPIEELASSWVSYHVTAVCAKLAWSFAMRSVERSIANRWADWSRESEPFSSSVAWYVNRRGNNFRFVAYAKGASKDEFTTFVPDKPRRVELNQHKQNAGYEAVCAMAGSPCLNWDARDGWRAGTTVGADLGTLVKRVRVLHVTPRANCWLYTSDQQFFARLIDGVIQVNADSALGALNAMRRALAQYRRTFEADHACASSPAKDHSNSLPKDPHMLSNAIHKRVVGLFQDQQFWSRTHHASEEVRKWFWSSPSEWSYDSINDFMTDDDGVGPWGFRMRRGLDPG